MGSCRGVDWSLLLLLVRSVYGDLLSFPVSGCWCLGVSDLLLLLVSLGVLRLFELLCCCMQQAAMAGTSVTTTQRL